MEKIKMENKDILFNHPLRTSPLNEFSVHRGGDKGRSMVEMLCVLAIVGVLSAGALKGYSNAMFKYKMNKTIDIVNNVLQKIIELDQKELGDNVSFETADDMIQYGILPDCQKENVVCRLPIGTIQPDIYTDPDGAGGALCGSIQVYFTSSKECIAFASANWENAMPIEWFRNSIYEDAGGMVIIGTDEGSYPIYNPNNQEHDIVTNSDMSVITEACSHCNGDYGCYFDLVIRYWM